jgi:hypothetical protein
LQTLTTKTYTNGQLLTIATRYARGTGLSNPWSVEDNPTEHAAWPTVEELATHLNSKLLNEIKQGVGRGAGKAHDDTTETARDSAVSSARDEL